MSLDGLSRVRHRTLKRSIDPPIQRRSSVVNPLGERLAERLWLGSRVLANVGSACVGPVALAAFAADLRGRRISVMGPRVKADERRLRPKRRTIIETSVANLAWEDAYKLLIGSVIPRPIAWVSTRSADGVNNIAPFSFFNGFSAAPLILGFAPMASDDRPQKDTLANITVTGQFVINIATEETLAQMDATGRAYPADVDEFDITGLTPQASVAVAPPRIAEAPINFECELFSLVPLGDGEGSATLVLGRAVHIHVSDDVLRSGKIDPDLLKPVARMGGPFYARPQKLAFRRADRDE